MAANSRVSVLLALQTLNLTCLGTVLDLDPLDVVDLSMIMTVVDLHVVATVLVATATVRDLLVGTTMIIVEAVADTDLHRVLVDPLRTIHLYVVGVVVVVTMSRTVVGTTLQLIHMLMVPLDRMSAVLHVTIHPGMLLTLVTPTNVVDVINFNL